MNKIKYLKYKTKYLKLKNQLTLQIGGNKHTIDIYIKSVSDTVDEINVFISDNLFMKFTLEILNEKLFEDYIVNCVDKKWSDIKSKIEATNLFELHTILYLENFYVNMDRENHIEALTKLMDCKDETMRGKELDSYEKTTEIYPNIKLKDIKGIPSDCLKHIINFYRTKYDNIILALNVIDGNNDRSKTYKNYHLSNSERINNLINFYKQFNLESIKCTTTYPLYQTQKQFTASNSIFKLPYNLNFMYGIIEDKLKNFNKTDICCDDIGVYSWGLGIENEAFLYTKIDTNDNKKTINVFPLSIYLQKFDLFDDHGVKEYFRDIIQSTEHKLFENQFTYLNLISEGNNTIAGGMIEIITNNYLKPSINNNINELMNNKKLMLNIINRRLGTQYHIYNSEFYTDVKYKQLNNTDIPDITRPYDYLGSYHFNITLPHLRKGTTETETFTNRHKNFAIGLQLIEPLLLGVFGIPDAKSFNETKVHSRTEASYRLFNSHTMFIGTAPINKFGFEATRDKINYGVKLQPSSGTTLVKDFIDSIIPTNMNETYNESSLKRFREQDTLGYDIAKRPDHYGYPRLFFGFEFRLMDCFPEQYLNIFTKLLFLLAFYLDHADINLIDKSLESDVFFKSEIRQQIKNTIEEGYNAKIDDEYKKLLNDKLKLTNEHNSTYDFLNNLFQNLKKYYYDNKLSDITTERNRLLSCYNEIIEEITENDLPNPNKETMNSIIEHYKTTTNISTKTVDEIIALLKTEIDEKTSHYGKSVVDKLIDNYRQDKDLDKFLNAIN